MADNQAHPERYPSRPARGVTAVFDVGAIRGRANSARAPNTIRSRRMSPRGRAARALDPKVLVLPTSTVLLPQTPDEAREFGATTRPGQRRDQRSGTSRRPATASNSGPPWCTPRARRRRRRGVPLIVHSTTLATARDAVAAGAFLLVHSVEEPGRSTTSSSPRCESAGHLLCPTLTVSTATAVWSTPPRSRRGALAADLCTGVKARVLRTDDLKPSIPRRLENAQRIGARGSRRCRRTSSACTPRRPRRARHRRRNRSRCTARRSSSSSGRCRRPAAGEGRAGRGDARRRRGDWAAAPTRPDRRRRIADLLVLDADPEQDVKRSGSLPLVVARRRAARSAALLRAVREFSGGPHPRGPRRRWTAGDAAQPRCPQRRRDRPSACQSVASRLPVCCQSLASLLTVATGRRAR